MSANKNTPTKGCYDISKSPNAHKKKKTSNFESVVTQTEYIIPVTGLDNKELSNSDSNGNSKPSFGTHSLLHKRTFSMCFGGWLEDDKPEENAYKSLQCPKTSLKNQKLGND